MTDKRFIKSKRRYHSAAFKREVVGATREVGASVVSVALRYGVNSNLVFKWRRDDRFNGKPAFLPVEVVCEGRVSGAGSDVGSNSCSEIADPVDHVEVCLGQGRVLHLPLALSDAAVRRLVRLVESA